MEKNIYERLARHLDKLPGGFPASPSGVELRILKRNSARCIGCGLCVSTCPTGSLTLMRKPSSEQMKVPMSMDATWVELTQV